MNIPDPNAWFSTLIKSAWTLLLVGLAAFVAWQLLKPLLVPLVVLLALVGTFKLALGMYRRDRW